MKIIFGTTNKRKMEDLEIIINKMDLDIEVMSLIDIGWDRGDIVENGNSIEENSLIKANAIFDFCKANDIKCPIITDDAGLFCDALNGEPGIYTARYADEELLLNSELPKYQCVFKLLDKMNGITNRKAFYRCCVTLMMPDGSYFQEVGESSGVIAEEVVGNLKKPYFYSIFILDSLGKVFSDLDDEELEDTYRYSTLKRTLVKIYK